MSRRDMEMRRLGDGDLVRVKSRRGSVVVEVEASETLRPGQSFIPMHWGGRNMNSGGANAITIPAFDASSKQPELKHAAVQVEKLHLPYQVVAMRRFEAGNEGDALRLMAALQPLLAQFDHAQAGLAGREVCVVQLRGYNAAPVADGDSRPPHDGRFERPGRGCEPAHQAGQALRARLPEREQLPAPDPPRGRRLATARLRPSRASDPAVPGWSRRAPLPPSL